MFGWKPFIFLFFLFLFLVYSFTMEDAKWFFRRFIISNALFIYFIFLGGSRLAPSSSPEREAPAWCINSMLLKGSGGRAMDFPCDRKDAILLLLLLPFSHRDKLEHRHYRATTTTTFPSFTSSPGALLSSITIRWCHWGEFLICQEEEEEKKFPTFVVVVVPRCLADGAVLLVF